MKVISSNKSNYTQLLIFIFILLALGVVYKTLYLEAAPFLGILFLLLVSVMIFWFIDYRYLIADRAEYDRSKVKVTYKKDIIEFELSDIRSMSVGFPNGRCITLFVDKKGIPKKMRFYAQVSFLGIGYTPSVKEFMSKIGKKC